MVTRRIFNIFITLIISAVLPVLPCAEANAQSSDITKPTRERVTSKKKDAKASDQKQEVKTDKS